MRLYLFLSIMLVLAACTQQDSGVRISKAEPKPTAPAAVVTARTEPIFYNGKTYTLKFAPAGKGTFDIAVLGMTAKQQKDAVAVGTSSIRYFACPEEQTGKLTNQAQYVGDQWRMQARCG